ncbi:MAG: 16S rRNA processing protein RimM [Oscillospiraceae bacterium]|nr:16S rRNA processing protein RimM [Oscillospiraceae bacterium]
MKLQFIEAGEIVTTHGIKGEVKVLPWLDSPEDLCDFERCRINGREYNIESCRVQKTCNLVKLSGIDTMEAAQAMRGKTIELYREDIDDEVIFAAELIGVEVYQDGQAIGKITDVLDYPGNSVYVVKGDHEYMIPAVKQFILNTNVDGNRMDVKLIEGMRTDEN